ncbi:MAG: ExbD/TolR family protein [Fibrobacterota bacterium]
MSRRRTRRRRRSISELNLTNLVDVVFALLIIFMITAPMMTQGVQVDLPKADSDAVEADERVLNVVIRSRDELYIGKRRTDSARFARAFAKKLNKEYTTPVYVSVDQDVPAGVLIRIVSDIQQAGAVNLGFLTEPLEKTR